MYSDLVSRVRGYGLFVVGLVICNSLPAAQVPTDAGEYLFRAAGCASCHTDVAGKGPALAGGRALETPFGTFYTPNITPDENTGIGRWSAEDFLRALGEGTGPGNRHYYPVFPYTSYTRMKRDDMLALWRYLQTVPAVSRQNRPHDLPWIMSFRLVNWAWKLLFFQPGAMLPQAERSTPWNRGAYIAQALAHCGECHTPRNIFGVTRPHRRFAGTEDGPEGEPVPNITPDRDTGIGRWRKSEIVDYLQAGELPDGDYAGGLMAEVIDDGLQYLRPDDLQALAEYLKSLPPLASGVKEKPKPPKTSDY